MATEDIKVQDGHIIVERAGNKENVNVAASDVDSVTFTRGVWDGPGALVLHTTKGDVVIRVDNEDAGDALSIVRSVVREETANEQAAENEQAPESNEETRVPAQPQRANARRK
jgi:hypothetical protein